MVKARMPVMATATTRGRRRASRRLTAGVRRKARVRAKAKGMRSSRAKYRIRTVTASTRKGPTRENSVLRGCDMGSRVLIGGVACPGQGYIKAVGAGALELRRDVE